MKNWDIPSGSIPGGVLGVLKAKDLGCVRFGDEVERNVMVPFY
jgi:hypothetical protein